MRNRPTKFPNVSLYFLVLVLLLGCSKDSDLLNDALFNGETQSVEDRAKTETSTEETDTETQPEVPNPQPQTESVEEPTEESSSNLESRLTTFTTLHDAHLQSGKGYNQSIIRLEEGHRTSYLMFDLSPIDSIGATITEAKLQITINSDDGDGTVSVNKGVSSDWTENNLSASTPGIESELGSLTKQYKIGATEEIDLDVTSLQATKETLILEHKEGNDLAFASKEHPSDIGPKLVVTYDAPVGAAPIEIPDTPVEEETPSAEEETPSGGENTNTEETPVQAQNEGPMAVADATPSSGGAPLNVQFKGSNSTDDDSVKSYSWDFKDGSSATTADPSHSFNQTGVYEVVLTVTDEQGLTDSDIVTINVNENENEAPKAVVSASPSSGTAPLNVQFNGGNSTDDNSISSYAWNFKDGTSASNANPSHQFTQAGTYEVELTVKDENGLSDTETVTITVVAQTNEAPKAVVSASPSSGTAPLNVQFNGGNSTDDNSISSYAWNFKDGASGSNANPSHQFTQAGTYEVELTVTDEHGLSDTKTVTITVVAQTNVAPVAVATATPTSGVAPLEVQFVGNQSTDDNAITSYTWDFKDGGTASSLNPSHSFVSPGNYAVTLTVQDAQGLSSTQTVDITVNAPQNNNNNPGDLDYYVTVNGSGGNNGKSESSAWSLEHAFNNAQPGDVIYVKAGNYGNKQLLSKRNGYNGGSIKFIGYRYSPGDLNSSGGSTFNYGESVDSSKMPLLTSYSDSGVAITLHHAFIHIENFQINGYGTGIQSIDNAGNAVLKNIIITNSGNQNNQSVYNGFGMSIRGNNTIIENCFVHNASAEGIKLYDSDYSKISNCAVYGSNPSNPTDYYYLLANGTSNTVVENSRAERSPGLSHGGHGFNVKNSGSYNTFRNCTAIRTNFELTYSGVHNNTIDGGSILGVNTSSSNWHAVMSIVGGAHHNLIRNLSIQDTWAAISLATYNDRTGADASLGNDNVFENITIKNTDRILNIGGGTNYGAKARNYTFNSCNFSNFNFVAVVQYGAENFSFNNSSFSNGNNLVTRVEGYEPHNTFYASWSNCSWSNVNFTPPN